jgi:cytochrome c oxidase subunit IV
MSEHILDTKVYLKIFGLLIGLTVVTVVAAFINLGPLNTPIALLIAVVKATFVLLFFMHLKFSSQLNKLVAVAGLLWLIVLIGFTMSDFLTRPWLPG